MCHGAAITKKINVLEPKRILDRWRRFAVRRRYNPIAAAGKTRAIKPLGRTVRAGTAARPQQAKRDGSGPPRVRQKKPRLGNSPRPTRKSGIKKRGKKYGPKERPE